MELLIRRERVTSSATRAHERERLVLVPLFALFALVPCLLVAPSALAAQTVVTALFGTVQADGDEIGIGDHLSVDDPDVVEVESSLDSGAALLHGDALLIEMGPSTKLKIRSGVGDDGPVVEISNGSARITTRLDESDAATEIRTPSAIIRPRSSTLHLDVNGEVGTTMVASLENRAFVLSNDERHKRGVYLNTSQYVVVPKGAPPGSIEKMEVTVRESLSGPATQRRYRDSALTRNMSRESERLLADIAQADVPEGELSSLANPLPTPKAFTFEPETIDRTLVCDPTTCGLFSVPEFDPGPADPPGCIGIPGEQCQR